MPFSKLCNLSIFCGGFPDACKVAKLKPVYKKGKLTHFSNCRPIYLLSIISKVIERVAGGEIHVSQKNILCNYQSGFSPNHSANLCLLYLTDKMLKGFDGGTGMVLIDF